MQRGNNKFMLQKQINFKAGTRNKSLRIEIHSICETGLLVFTHVVLSITNFCLFVLLSMQKIYTETSTSDGTLGHAGINTVPYIASGESILYCPIGNKRFGCCTCLF